MSKRLILFILFLSAICHANARHILVEDDSGGEDDSTTNIDDIKTTPSVTTAAATTIAEVTTPRVTNVPITTAPPITAKPTTQIPTAPPVNDPPTIPAKPDDIINVATPAPTVPSQSTPGVVEKVVEKVPPITITKETTDEFINSIPSSSQSQPTEEGATDTATEAPPPPPPTIPPVQQDKQQTETPKTQLDSLKNGKIYGVAVEELVQKPTIDSIVYGEDDKKTVIYAESKNDTFQIFEEIKDSVVQNIEINIHFNIENSGDGNTRILAGKTIPVIKNCGLIKGNIINSYVYNFVLRFDQDLIFECEVGFFTNKIINSTISNVRIEFFNDNNPIYWFIHPKESFGILASEVTTSHLFMTRITGDYLYIWPKASEAIVSPFVGKSELTLIETCYVDLQELIVNFNDMPADSNDNIVIGGLVGEYIISEEQSIFNETTTTTTAASITTTAADNAPRRNIDELDDTTTEVNDNDTPPVFNKTNNEIYRSFVLVRRGFSIPKINEVINQKKCKVTYGGLIGKVTMKSDGILFIDNCYYSMIANGIVNPLDDQKNIRFGGLIGEKEDNSNSFIFQLNMTYVNYIVKTNYMDIDNFGIYYGGKQGNITTSFLNNFGYVSLPFASNQTESNGYTLYNHYLTLSESNKTVINRDTRLLEASSSFISVIAYGRGVDENIDEYEKDNDVAEAELMKAGFTINPYTKKIKNEAPSPTNEGGFYDDANTGLNLSPEGRGSPPTSIKYKLLKDQSKLNSKMTCPNNCNKNGACYYGKCYCNSYYTGVDCSERFCPFGIPLTNITYNKNSNLLDVPSLECSNQGKCDRTTGRCECFPGYEGTACQRTRCPNDCSYHGVCTTVSEVSGIDIGTSDENDEYVVEYDRKINNYRDNSVSVCVCDKEYEGDDCSRRKCPFGYTPSSDCEAGNVDGIKITFKQNTATNKMIYVKYIDPFKHVWYTHAFDYSSADAWSKALNSLPTGVISISSLDKVLTDDSQPNDEFSIDISYSIWQTGKQPAIKIIDKVELLDMNIPTDGSYFGLKLLPDMLDTSTAGGVAFTVEVGDSLKALPCSNNGICNSVTGICKCIEMYYGNACELQTEVI